MCHCGFSRRSISTIECVKGAKVQSAWTGRMNEVLKVPFLRTVAVISVELIATDNIHVEAVDDMARAAYSYRQCGVGSRT